MEKTLWEIYNDTQLAELETLTADYKDFLDAGKTERECVTEVIRLAEKEGYVDLNQKDTLQAGDKVYLDWTGWENLSYCSRSVRIHWKTE